MQIPGSDSTSPARQVIENIIPERSTSKAGAADIPTSLNNAILAWERTSREFVEACHCPDQRSVRKPQFLQKVSGLLLQDRNILQID
jgi:hypothetical protein